MLSHLTLVGDFIEPRIPSYSQHESPRGRRSGNAVMLKPARRGTPVLAVYFPAVADAITGKVRCAALVFRSNAVVGAN